ncbi:hypothetical protein PR048_016048 [Dryococelus australis]|uniref:Uncharacterized protein n=1 Tax=Dryococelus australis TaxID=614101 RepID=A0ABQ9HIM6_9NEOP|nr:hypothetical protein PR048_016048 [Dryococelus australis]
MDVIIKSLGPLPSRVQDRMSLAFRAYQQLPHSNDSHESSDDVTSVTEKGISTLIKTSIKRKNGKSSQLKSDSIVADLKRQATSASSQPDEMVLYETFVYVKGEQKTDYDILKGMEKIYSYMEGNDDCQFSMNEFMAAVTENQLNENYGDSVLFKPGSNQFNIPIICSRYVGHKLLNDAWYNKREKNDNNERMKIVRSAADIIRQDIQSHIYDSHMYPPSDDFVKNVDCLPPTLLTFLQEVINKKTKRVEETSEKCIAIAHAITSAVRPRAFLSSVLSRIPLLTKMPSSFESGNPGIIPLETFQGKVDGRNNVIVGHLEVPEESAHPPSHDILWLFAQKQRIPVLQWKGYMHIVTRGDYSKKNEVSPLPFINAPPSNYDTVYTALSYAAELCEKINHLCVIIMFDQPLYCCIGKGENKLQVLHLTLSYLRCIGYIMSGSGLKVLWSTVYAVDKMLQGHTFAREAIGHLLIKTNFSNIMPDNIQINEEEQTCVKEVMSNFQNEPPSLYSFNENPHLKSLGNKYGEALQQLNGNGRTAKLWIQYSQMVNLMKEYIHVQRLRGQVIGMLTSLVSRIYHSFMNLDTFPKLNSATCVWSDMTIETTLMCSFKSHSGIMGGRGVISKWVVGASATPDICTSLDEFYGYSMDTTTHKIALRWQNRYDAIRCKRSVDIHFNMDTKIPVNQELLLSNQHNRAILVELLGSKLHDNGIDTIQAPDDADLLIVRTVIEKSMEGTAKVAVIAVYVDLAVLLTAKTLADHNIPLVKPGRGKVETNEYSTQQMQHQVLNEILFLHAFTGCDTPSAAFRRSKLGFTKLYNKHQDIRRATEVSSTPAVVELAGKGATKEHSFRTFLQVQLWLDQELLPELWGWKRRAYNIVAPELNKEPAASEEIWNAIFYKCTEDYSSKKYDYDEMEVLPIPPAVTNDTDMDNELEEEPDDEPEEETDDGPSVTKGARDAVLSSSVDGVGQTDTTFAPFPYTLNKREEVT